MRLLRIAALIVCLGLLVNVHAQDPSVVNSSVGPIQGLGLQLAGGGGFSSIFLDAPQRVTLTIASSTNSVTSASLLVSNSANVRIRKLGSSPNETGNQAAIALCALSVGVVDGTHVTVTATRGNNTATIVVTSVEIETLNPNAFSTIQRGSVAQTTSGTSAITAVSGRATLDYIGETSTDLGGNADEFSGYCVITTNILVTCNSFGASAKSFQIVDWK